jgi:peptidyl-prolyl cis-trans isomerase SurA
MNSIAQQNGTDLDALRQRLAHDGIDFDDFRARRDEITVQRLRQSFAQSRISVSEGEVDAALKQQATAATSTTWRTSWSPCPTAPTPTRSPPAREGRRREEPAGQGRAGLQRRRRALFGQPQRAGRRRPGLAQPGRNPAAFAQMMEKMKPGEVVGPIRGPSGFQLLKLVEVRDSSASRRRRSPKYHARHILVRVDDPRPTPPPRRRSTPCVPASPVAPTSRRWPRNPPRTTTAATRAAIWAGSRPMRSVRPGGKVTSLADNGVSEPFRTDAGWHIVQRVATRQTDVTNDNQRAQVRETIGRRKLEDEYNRFLQELRGEAYVSFRTGDARIDRLRTR